MMDRLRKIATIIPRLKKVSLLCGWVLFGLVVVFVIHAAWQQRGWRNRFSAEAEEARTLALTYDAVRLAPKPFWSKPVLWKLGCQYHGATTCYYEGDLNKPVRFPDGTEIPNEGHKGMSPCLVLGRVQRVDPQGIYLEFLRNY